MAFYDDKEFFESYSHMPRSEQGLSAAGEWWQLEAMLPRDLTGMSVLDVGCGCGWHCAWAAGHGAARVLGIDPSEKMLAEARARNAHRNIEYRLSAVEGFDWPEEEYELVISNLALHYVEDLDAVYAGVFRALKPGGSFVLNIEHPVFTSGVNEDWCYDSSGNIRHWPVDGYFYPGARSTLFVGCEVTKYHHTLAQIMGGLLRAGFSLAAVDEARPSEAALRDIPGMADEMRRPMMLLLRAEKPADR